METFVIRVFVAGTGEAMPLRGVAEHVGSGSREPFDGADRLIGFLEASVTRTEPPEHREPSVKGDLA